MIQGTIIMTDSPAGLTRRYSGRARLADPPRSDQMRQSVPTAPAKFDKFAFRPRFAALARRPSSSQTRWKRCRTCWKRAYSGATRACAGFCTPAHAFFTAFARLHPDIEIEILSSGELANLTNREADVAIRVVYDRKTLPLDFHGLKGPELFGGVCICSDRLAEWRMGAPDPIRWIVISIHGIPDRAREGEVHTTGDSFRTNHAETQIAAAAIAKGHELFSAHKNVPLDVDRHVPNRDPVGQASRTSPSRFVRDDQLR
jgi:hypothetical protein